MNHRLRTTLTATTLAVVALAAAGCSSAAGNDQPTPAPVRTVSPTPSAGADGIDSTDGSLQPWPREPELQFPTASALAYDPQLQQVALAPPPTGTGPQIALRFLQALQRGDDLGADRELFSMGRDLLGTHDLTFLHDVMDDVRANAALHTAGPCTRADHLSSDSAVATCGQQRIAVHVMAGAFGKGVQISDWLRHDDHYRGKHTHAFTTRL